MSFPELQALSASLAALTAGVAPRIVAIQGRDGRELSGFIWRTGLAITADEALEGDDEVAVLAPTASPPPPRSSAAIPVPMWSS